MRVDFYKNRDKLLKDGKYLLYEDNKIILSKSYVESFKDKFTDWQDPTN